MTAEATSVSVSVVVVSHNEGEYLHRTVHSLLAGLPSDGEILVVDDGSTDGSSESLAHGYRRVTVLHTPERLGIAGSRNFGASHALGTIIVFSDAHVEVPRNWLFPLVKSLNRPEIGAVAPAVSPLGSPRAKGYGARWAHNKTLKWQWLGRQGPDPHPVPLLCGCFLALRRDVLEIMGGFDAGMIMWGFEDVELSLRLWTFGYECWVVPTLNVAHLFRRTLPSYQLDMELRLHNVLRLAVVHFGSQRLQRVIDSRVQNNAFPRALARLVAGDTWARREAIHARRCHDDDWFFDRFDMD